MKTDRSLENYELRKKADKERGTKKSSGFQLKDYITVCLSLFAFSLSALTAYLTVLRMTERLDITLMEAPQLQMTKDQLINWKGHLNFAFVNNGTLPIAVADATLILFPSTKPEEAGACISEDGATSIELALVTDSFVVKPTEIVIKNLAPAVDAQQSIDLKTKFKPEEWFQVVGCLQLRFITSRGGEIGSDTFGAWPRNDPGPDLERQSDYLPMPWRRVPMTFVDRTRWRFWSDE